MENNNYNINFDPDKLTSAEIDQHKDFDALLKQFETPQSPHQPKIKSAYYIVGAVAAVLTGTLLYFNWMDLSNNGIQISTSEYLASQPYINPPIEGVEKKFDQGQINANQGGIYRYENGTKVIVPAAAFIDDKGKVVSGPVDIKYREYHDYIDFFVSGIPMEYDSAGVQYNLESAGMMEIYAEQDGKRLNIAPGKNINVEMVSEIMVPAKDRASIPKFNIYKLDEEQRNWVYDSRDQIEILEEDITGLLAGESSAEQEYNTKVNQIEANKAREMAKIEATIPQPFKPVRPIKENGSDYVFNIEFADEDISFGRSANPGEAEREMDQTQDEINQLQRQYANTLWQIAPQSTNFNQQIADQINWEDATIERLNNRDYRLTLIHPDQTLEVIVNPVLSAQDYSDALEEFNQQMDAYQEELAQREAQLEDQKKALAERIRAERELAQKSYEEKLAYYQSKDNSTAATDLMITNRILNKFTVNSFGIWNCDRPLPPFIYNIKGEFVENKSNKHYKHNTAYLVDKNKNTVCRFYASEKAEVLFDSKSENMLWMITNENKIAMYRPEQFKQINKQTGEHTFVMDLVDEPITSEEDLRRILTF